MQVKNLKVVNKSVKDTYCSSFATPLNKVKCSEVDLNH